MSLIFTELRPDETFVERAIMTGVFSFFSAALIGYLNPRLWLIGVLTSWSGIVLGFPVACSVLGAFLGARLSSAFRRRQAD